MFWIGVEIGVVIGLYIAFGFKLAIDILQHTAKPTAKDRAGALFVMLCWLPLFLIGVFLTFIDHLRSDIHEWMGDSND